MHGVGRLTSDMVTASFYALLHARTQYGTCDPVVVFAETHRGAQPNSSAIKMFHSLPAVEPPVVHDPAWTAPPEAPLKMDFVMQQIQQQLLAGDQDMAVLVDTGDSMFRTQKLKLPGDTPYEVQVRCHLTGGIATLLCTAPVPYFCPVWREGKPSSLCSRTPSRADRWWHLYVASTAAMHLHDSSLKTG